MKSMRWCVYNKLAKECIVRFHSSSFYYFRDIKGKYNPFHLLLSISIYGVSSSKVIVDSGVPNGTVLGPLLFLCHIIDLPLAVSSQVRLFVDLGITLTEDLEWNSQITKTTKKANSTLAFLRRNLQSFPLDCRKSAYTTLVRSLLDYGSIIWDPYLKQDIGKLERVQRQAARFITGDYKTREEGCVIARMLETLEPASLEQRRSFNRLVFMYKVVEGLVPAIPVDDFLKPQKPKRHIRPKKYSNHISKT